MITGSYASFTAQLEGTIVMADRAEITAGLAEILEEVAGVNPSDVAEEQVVHR